MDIPKEYSNHRPLPGQSGNRSRQAEAVDRPSVATDVERSAGSRERRLRPDRRQQQQPFSGRDRRRSGDRRRTQLLNPRNGQAATTETTLGRNLSIRV